MSYYTGLQGNEPMLLVLFLLHSHLVNSLVNSSKSVPHSVGFMPKLKCCIGGVQVKGKIIAIGSGNNIWCQGKILRIQKNQMFFVSQLEDTIRVSETSVYVAKNCLQIYAGVLQFYRHNWKIVQQSHVRYRYLA
jgi:hypothetical protein